MTPLGNIPNIASLIYKIISQEVGVIISYLIEPVFDLRSNERLEKLEDFI